MGWVAGFCNGVIWFVVGLVCCCCCFFALHFVNCVLLSFACLNACVFL